MIRVCGIVGRNGCIALHYYVHFLRVFVGSKVRVLMQDLYGTRLRLRNAQPARENVGIKLGAISIYATGLTHSTI